MLHAAFASLADAPLAGRPALRNYTESCRAPDNYQYPRRVRQTKHHAMRTAEHVTREINLIARNLECLGEKEASAASAGHVRRFWAPLLRAELYSVFRDHPERFSPIARDAIRALEVSALRARGPTETAADRSASPGSSPLPDFADSSVTNRCEDAR
jgi:formate dehydrogenase subunit delta